MIQTIQPSTRQERKYQTDEKIIQAAILEFGENGYNSTTVTGIAKRAGVSQGLISQRFKNKISILAAAQERDPFVIYVRSLTYESLYEALLGAIDVLAISAKESPDWFRFIYTMTENCNIPNDARETMRLPFDESNLPSKMVWAQEQGQLPVCDPWEEFSLLVKCAVHVIEWYTRMGIDIPDGQCFFRAIQFNPEKE